MEHKFVEFIPETLESNILYISLEYKVVKHKCPCGCGDEIVTTLSPDQWSLLYDGRTVSLYPSIGNWTHKCQSHYFIIKDEIVWVTKKYGKKDKQKKLRKHKNWFFKSKK